MPFMNQLEPESLVRHFIEHPPRNFRAGRLQDGIPAFSAPFDILTTANPGLVRWIRRLPFHQRWRHCLQPMARFIGSTVSEYVWMPVDAEPVACAQSLKAGQAATCPLLIIKDIPHASPLLDAAANAWADAFVAACLPLGFTLVEGQALAWVPIDFDSIDDYLARLSRGRRRNLRRKLRSRGQLDVEVLPTGPALDDDGLVDALYSLYQDVFAQSETQFDLLERDFFAAVFRDGGSGGVLFLYRDHGRLIGWNLCFEHAGMLVDKYMGLAYPEARDCNLYAVSWFQNLDYARRRGLRCYIAGWTDPQAKAQLGARFTHTRHLVRPRNVALRVLLRRISGQFENDRDWRQSLEQDASACP